MGGPKGCGALILRDAALVSAETQGGGQERGLRGGTENVTGIAGFGAAAREASEKREGMAEIARLRDDIPTLRTTFDIWAARHPAAQTVERIVARWTAPMRRACRTRPASRCRA